MPDHAVQIHETIRDVLNGDVDDLGDAIFEILGVDDRAYDDSSGVDA